ncbi:uncharacterized protein METZ01_LOCUS152174, partial [marine metagenome]
VSAAINLVQITNIILTGRRSLLRMALYSTVILSRNSMLFSVFFS